MPPQKSSTLFPPLILIIGDALVLLSFVLIGRRSHALSAGDILSAAATALPFLVSWFLITPWFGLYRPEISLNRAKLWPRLAAGWLVAVLAGQVIRALLLGRPIPAGIPLTFVLVSLAYIGGVMLVWRLGYIWWNGRRSAGGAL
jgi:hypothetical protein